MWMMLQQDVPDDYIIASGKVHSVKELVKYAFDAVNLDWEAYVSVDPEFYRPDESVQLMGSIAKAKQNLNWEPEYSLKQLVELMVDYEMQDLTQGK
jgi:GDPmannose 4,6-dehydratase